MAKVMLTFNATPAPSLAQVKTRFGLSDDEIDEAFGVIEVDPETHTHTILVEQAAAARITGQPGWEGQGPFANPKIQPFGPPER
ncbi:MAG: hypothetical protein ABI895_12110 [Deltaproteobacteria bacterium]